MNRTKQIIHKHIQKHTKNLWNILSSSTASAGGRRQLRSLRIIFVGKKGDFARSEKLKKYIKKEQGSNNPHYGSKLGTSERNWNISPRKKVSKKLPEKDKRTNGGKNKNATDGWEERRKNY